MSDTFELHIENAKQVNTMLQRLEKKVINKVAKDIAKDSLKPMLAEARSNALSLGSGRVTSLLSSKLKIYLIKRRNLRRGHYGAQIRYQDNVSGLISYQMGSFSSLATKKTYGKRYFIPNAIEYGHAFPGRGGSKNSPKDVPARPYIRPAFDRDKEKCAKLADKLVREFIDSVENNT